LKISFVGWVNATEVARVVLDAAKVAARRDIMIELLSFGVALENPADRHRGLDSIDAGALVAVLDRNAEANDGIADHLSKRIH
jgi:hypothetical protein